MKQTVRVFVAGAILAAGVAVARPASAQDLSVGYQYQRITNGDGLNLPLGFDADVSMPIGDGLSVVGQVDWSRKKESENFLGTSFDATLNLTAFGGGVRWTGAGAGVRPYVQGLVGAMHTSASCSVAGVNCNNIIGDSDTSQTDAMLQLGGGVTFPLTPRLSGLGQFDYRRIFSDGEDGNTIRVVVGVRVGLR